jgi:hypothetical protein
MARVLALGGKIDEAKKSLGQAQVAGDQIADAKDKKIFDDDFNGGEWYEIK